ncbi:hypothetical protein HBB16_04795 [Pseudonocardia sp. MCCB 268]|nr:hypothetical protein [Pseudonocardia cytotoxica]
MRCSPGPSTPIWILRPGAPILAYGIYPAYRRRGLSRPGRCGQRPRYLEEAQRRRPDLDRRRPD